MGSLVRNPSGDCRRRSLARIRHVSDGDLILKVLRALDTAADLTNAGIAPEIETIVEGRALRRTALHIWEASRRAFSLLNRS
jgi:hypothetical protein